MWKQYRDLPRAVHILCLGTFINRAGNLVVPFLTLYLQKELGLGKAFATEAIGVYGAGALVSSLVGGHLGDRVGRRVVMLAALAGGAGLILVFGTLTTRGEILLGLLAFSLLAEMYRPAASAMIADLVEPAQRQHAFGLMYVAVNLGFSVGPFVAGILSQYSFRLLFWGDALTTLIYAAIILLAIRETLPARAGPPQQTANPAAGETALDYAVPPPVRRFDAFRDILGNRPFLVFCLSLFLIGIVFHQAMSTFPLYLDDLGISGRDYGWIIALNGVMITCLQLPLTAMLTRFHRAGVIAIGAALTGVGFGLIGMAAAPWQFAMTVVVWTLGEMMGAPLNPAIVSDLAPTRFRATYFGLVTMSFSGAMMIGPPLGGRVLARFGPGTLWTGCMVVGLVAAVLLLSIARHIGSGASRPIVASPPRGRRE